MPKVTKDELNALCAEIIAEFEGYIDRLDICEDAKEEEKEDFKHEIKAYKNDLLKQGDSLEEISEAIRGFYDEKVKNLEGDEDLGDDFGV